MKPTKQKSDMAHIPPQMRVALASADKAVVKPTKPVIKKPVLKVVEKAAAVTKVVAKPAKPVVKAAIAKKPIDKVAVTSKVSSRHASMVRHLGDLVASLKQLSPTIAKHGKLGSLIDTDVNTAITSQAWAIMIAAQNIVKLAR